MFIIQKGISNDFNVSLIKANCPNVFINPKKNEANKTDHGFHLPKINAAKAKNQDQQLIH